MNITIWDYWRALRYVWETRDYIQTSKLFAYYERPITTLLWATFPFLHILLAAALIYFYVKINTTQDAWRRHNAGPGYYFFSFVPLIIAYVCLGLYVFAGTMAGKNFERFTTLERAYPGVVPATLPPFPALIKVNGWVVEPHPNDMRYWVTPARAAPLMAMRDVAPEFLTGLDFFIFFSWAPLAFGWGMVTYMRYFVFALQYDRATAKPHLPTEIVDRALSGRPLDHEALALAMSATTMAPVRPDSLEDKVERERLRKLATRLEADTSALNQKLNQEAQVARLVVDHARKRQELADMERQLQKMGVTRHD